MPTETFGLPAMISVSSMPGQTNDCLILTEPARWIYSEYGMASSENISGRDLLPSDDLMLREAHHRCHNDLQLVISLLAFQSNHASNPETQQAFADVIARVATLSRARKALQNERQLSLVDALEQVCVALNAQASLRAIQVSLKADQDIFGLGSTEIIILALVANELGTNAIKHGFADGKDGKVTFSLETGADADLRLIIDDDGLPFPDSSALERDGLGFGLVKRLMASIGGLFIPPAPGSKAFELRVSR